MSYKNLYRRQGMVMIMAMIALTVLVSLAVSMVTMSSINVAMMQNSQDADKSLLAAHSGVEVLQYWLDGLNVSSGTDSLSSIATGLNSVVTDAGYSNLSATYDGSQVNISLVSLEGGKTFSAAITGVDNDTVKMTLTGSSGQMSKTISANFNIVPRGNSVFDYGVATKGPLNMSGQAEMDGVNLAVESSVYIEGQVSGDAFSITNKASVSGEVFIADEYATYSVGNQSVVGGESGDDAHDHVIVGTPPSIFPTPNPSYFESFATGEVITSETNLDNYAVLNNVTIAANTNPTFSSNMTINGVLFIETPNVVHFSGKATVTGIIVGDGVEGESLPENGLVFSGQVDCYDVSQLVGSEFDDIKQETGTFILAPGFSADFSGQTTVANGAIAASGISFTGQAGGTINGSIINYSTQPVQLSGQTTLMFNRSGTESNPAGFAPLNQLDYLTNSYEEVHL